MIPVIRHTFSRYISQIIIWGFALGALCAYGLLLYDSLSSLKPNSNIYS